MNKSEGQSRLPTPPPSGASKTSAPSSPHPRHATAPSTLPPRPPTPQKKNQKNGGTEIPPPRMDVCADVKSAWRSPAAASSWCRDDRSSASTTGDARPSRALLNHPRRPHHGARQRGDGRLPADPPLNPPPVAAPPPSPSDGALGRTSASIRRSGPTEAGRKIARRGRSPPPHLHHTTESADRLSWTGATAARRSRRLAAVSGRPRPDTAAVERRPRPRACPKKTLSRTQTRRRHHGGVSDTIPLAVGGGLRRKGAVAECGRDRRQLLSRWSRLR